MGLAKFFKLEKLKIEAFRARGRGRADLIGSFEAMFNPESYGEKYEIQYGKGIGYNATGKEVDYLRSKPAELNLKLVLDGTGVDEIGLLQLRPRKSVAERVEQFLDLTFRMNGAIHEPNFLVVTWGTLIFSCRLGGVDIKYTSFDRDGTPLRAELDVALVGDREVKRRMRLEAKSSPDLTHSRVVKAGDTLPLLAKEVYGSSEHYLVVARANGLDDFRNLAPGQELVFPPLES